MSYLGGKRPPVGGIVYDQLLYTHYKMALRKIDCTESARNWADTCHHFVPSIRTLYGHVIF